MHTREARERFQRADQLFREKKFDDALALLNELDREFPDNKNILYPRAMCLARVGQFEEALELCRQLKVEFGDSRGEKLMAKIGDLRRARAEKEKAKQNAPAAASPGLVPAPNIYSLDSNPPNLGKPKNLEFSPVFNPDAALDGGLNLAANDTMDLGDGSPTLDMAALDDLFAPKGPPIAPPIKVEPKSRKNLYIGIGVAAGIVLLLALIPLFLRPSAQSAPAPAPATTVASEESSAAQPVPDAPPIAWLSSFEQAASRANEDGSPMLLFFYSSSAASPEVQQMDDYVWSDPSIRNLAKDWTCARIDIDAEPELQEQFEITTLPTTIFTSYYFDETDYRHEGATTAQDFYNAILAAGWGPVEEFTLPPMPIIALVLLPILAVIITTVPLLVTLIIFGKMPDDDPVSSVLNITLVGLLAPIFGRLTLRGAYDFGILEFAVYYALLLVHLVIFNAIMTALIDADMPFYVYAYAWFAMRS